MDVPMKVHHTTKCSSAPIQNCIGEGRIGGPAAKNEFRAGRYRHSFACGTHKVTSSVAEQVVVWGLT